MDRQWTNQNESLLKTMTCHLYSKRPLFLAMRSTSAKPPEPLGVLRGHGAPVNSVGFLSASTIVSGAGDGAVKIWDLKSRRELAMNPTAHSNAGVLHTAALRGAAASEQKFVTQGRDGFVKLWDTQAFGAAAEPLAKFYCRSYSFTKFATLRWPGNDAASTNLIVCPSSVDNKVSAHWSSFMMTPRLSSVLITVDELSSSFWSMTFEMIAPCQH